MASNSHLLFIFSQDEDYVGSENFFQHPSHFPTSASRSYNPNSSSTSINLIREFEPCEDNTYVGGKEVDEGSNMHIVEPSTKPTIRKRNVVEKKKAPANKRPRKVKVEGEEEEELVGRQS